MLITFVLVVISMKDITPPDQTFNVFFKFKEDCVFKRHHYYQDRFEDVSFVLKKHYHLSSSDVIC